MAGRRWRIGIAVAIAAAGALVAASGAWSSGRLPVAKPILVTQAFVVHADTLGRRETLSDVFARHDITGAELFNVLSVAEGLNPRRLRPGKVFKFRYALGNPKPDQVSVRINDDTILRLVRADSAWRAEPVEVTWSIETERAVGAIHSSLDDAIQNAVPDSILSPAEKAQLVWDLADDVFAWELDFTRDIYDGDRFDVLYERLVSSLGEVRYGRVLAARIESRGDENDAYVMTDGNGGNAYYDANGRSLKRAFKRYPVKYARISSGFSRSRFHPILHRWRAHLGTDYAAAMGTPIEATGDGTVIRAGRWGGYGIMVAIRHAKGIETRYGHMRALARGIHVGVRVKQGEVIGYVGMTGLATAPHVHYEFRKNGVALNPRAADLGDGKPIPADERQAFDSVRDRFNRYLGSLPPRDGRALASAAGGG